MSGDIQARASLTRAKLIFIAILSGGDYDKVRHIGGYLCLAEWPLI